MKKRSDKAQGKTGKSPQPELPLVKEKALLASDKRFKELTELLPLGVWEIDSGGMFTYINRRGMEYMSRAPEDLKKGISAAETLIPEDRERVRENMVKLLKGEKNINETEYTAIRPDGSTLPILIYSAPIVSDNRITGIRGITIDMSERKASEQSLRESEERYRTVFDNSGSPTVIAAEDTTILMVNKRYEELTGFSREELEGKKSWIEFISKEDLEKAIKQRDLRKNHPEKGINHFEFNFIDRYGKMKKIVATVDKMPGTSNVVASLVDITEQKMIQEVLRQARDELEKQNVELKKLDKIKDGLLRDVSHELKTPVAKHAMLVEILRNNIEKQGTSEEIERALQKIEANIKRQGKVINNILTLSRLEAGGIKYQIGRVRLDEVLKDVISDYKYATEAYCVSVKLCLQKVTIKYNKDMLWHVFSNLINNAIKYRCTDDSPRIEVYAGRDGESAFVRIADNGIGMSDEGRKRIFERFYQDSPASEGIGAGLSICKMIVEEFGGNLSLESEGLGKGAVAVLTFPMK